jgi:hypothetical protein
MDFILLTLGITLSIIGITALMGAFLDYPKLQYQKVRRNSEH